MTSWSIFIYILSLVSIVEGRTKVSDDAIGISDVKHHNIRVTASSFSGGEYYHPKLVQTHEGGAWCLNASLDDYKLLEIDLGETHRISAVHFKRIVGESKGNLSRYILMFKPSENSTWRKYRAGSENVYQFFNMNLTTGDEVVKYKLKGPHVMRYVKVIDFDGTGDKWCLQVELFGYPWKQGEGLLEYRMPQGQTRGGRISLAVDLLDDTYDGRAYIQGLRAAVLKDGLGQLTDGIVGSDGFWEDLGNGPGFEWVGWYDMFTRSPYITFHYDSRREFHKVRFHINNQPGNVKIFGKVQVSFSEEGEYFYHKFYYKPTKAQRALVEKAFFVEVDLQKARGQFVNFQFQYMGKWILFSEIEVDSVPVANGTLDYPPPKDIDDFSDQETEDKDNDLDLDLAQAASPKPRRKSNYTGLIVGVISAVAVAVILIIILVIRKRRQSAHQSHGTQFRNRIPVRLTSMEEQKNPKNNNAGVNKVNLPREKKKGEDLCKANNIECKLKVLDESEPYGKEDFPACKKTNTALSINPNLLSDSTVDKV